MKNATMNRLIYLAGPYTADPAFYYPLHLKYAAALFQANRLVFSPIAHCHSIAEQHTLPTDYEYWHAYNRKMIDHCDELYVMDVAGRETSKGVLAEIDYASELGKPIRLASLQNNTLHVMVGKF
jgi:nucleoside 2-deoxyribosyltransferase